MKFIRKHFVGLWEAEKFQDELYEQYDYVRLFRSPMFSEEGVYIWEVRD